MVVSNRDRVGKALEAVKAGLEPFVTREMAAKYGAGWQDTHLPPGTRSLDTTALLRCILDDWNTVFGTKLGNFERNLVHELRDARNKWAHDAAFTLDDAYRVLDSATRLLQAITAPQASDTEREMQEIMRARFEEMAKRETRRATVAPTEGRPATGFKPWREVITPHADVASGQYAQAEFAASLHQVHAGIATAEYGDPRDFFRRTYLTDGLRKLLRNALLRLGGTGGDPVVKLQTNFGGGKTHAMIALYHFCAGLPPGDLTGIEDVLRDGDATALPAARRAVLVGTALDPTKPDTKPDGTETRTLWGEMAWQLGGAAGYAMVAEADRAGVNPGSQVFTELFDRFGPCLVLVDEWVAYARNLRGVSGLPAGSFDANTSFAQALTEGAAAAKNALVVASIPASDIEKGGEAGIEATRILENIFRRVEDTWQPATTDEGFEIVRRRLFEPVSDPVARDAVARAFAEMYRAGANDYPAMAREGDYEGRIRAAYPIHPALFDDLFAQWSTLPRFQRTRGVLQLMAKVVHTLWTADDRNLLILPGSVPLDEYVVSSQLLGFLDGAWRGVVETDVDGPNALPRRLDGENAGTLGRYAATRRVARAVFLGSAPTVTMTNKGVDEKSIKLACMQPGENVATFGDALRRLTDAANYLYMGEGRYWYDTQPSVTRLAQDRAANIADHDIHEEIRRRLKDHQRNQGDFARVHLCPASTGDVPDDAEARLVILDPAQTHTARDPASVARAECARILDTRATTPRRYRNMLLFLAADKRGTDLLTEAVCQYLAWDSIWNERGAEQLNLDAMQQRQAETRKRAAGELVAQRLPEAYQWLLMPTQETHGPVEWSEHRLSGGGDDALAVRASRKLRSEEGLITAYSGISLKLQLDRVPLWRDAGDDVRVKQLWEDFAQYLYLPRLRDSRVLLDAVADGARQMLWRTETFAYAAGWDETAKRYLGLQTAETGVGSVVHDAASLVVRSDAARRQLDADDAARLARETPAPVPPSLIGGQTPPVPPPPGTPSPTPPPPSLPTPPAFTRFHGSVALNPLQPTGEMSKIAQEVLQHLTGIMGANVRVTLEIAADLPGGASDHIVRTVIENATTLKFTSKEFEEG